MKRVVVTGMGAATPIGNITCRVDQKSLTQMLLDGIVGITFDKDFIDHNFKSQYSGRVLGLDGWFDDEFPKSKRRNQGVRETLRFLGQGDLLKLSLLPAIAAVRDSGLTEENDLLSAGTFIGSGGPSTTDQVFAVDELHKKESLRKVAALVPATMSAGPSAIVSTYLQLRGGAISLTAACATGALNIGYGFEQVALGKRQIVLAGGVEDCHHTKAVGFEAMQALYRGDLWASQASRPFDVSRSGFVPASGGAVLVLEELEHARERGAHIYAEIVGAAYSSDGLSMVEPSGDGAVACMREALLSAGVVPDNVVYVNAHGTSTPKGDLKEIQALSQVFGEQRPFVTSTKAQVGHSLGGAGAVEAVFTILIMNAGVIPAQVNLEQLDPRIKDLGWDSFIPTQNVPLDEITIAMSNSFGFGGTNGTLVFRKY